MAVGSQRRFRPPAQVGRRHLQRQRQVPQDRADGLGFLVLRVGRFEDRLAARMAEEQFQRCILRQYSDLDGMEAA